MQVHSKFAQPEVISWKKYFDENPDLSKMKNRDLKEVLKHYKLHVTGKKSILIERIVNHFHKMKNAVKLQSILRMFIVNMMIRLRGPGLKNRKLCTNETDFFTLEPLNEISIYDFFSFKDDQGFIYGFDLNSLITVFRKSGSLMNPYNRNKLGFKIIKKISTLSKLNKYLNKKTEGLFSSSQIEISAREANMQKFQAIRNKEENHRIEELFHEMDLLGNYTNSRWFHNLTHGSFVHLLRHMWDIWNFRANIPMATKRKICPYFNPFTDGIESLEREPSNTQEERSIILKKSCLTVMENFVYSGINNEFKQLGCMIVLSALTMVSTSARNNLPWLYESLEPI